MRYLTVIAKKNYLVSKKFKKYLTKYKTCTYNPTLLEVVISNNIRLLAAY